MKHLIPLSLSVLFASACSSTSTQMATSAEQVKSAATVKAPATTDITRSSGGKLKDGQASFTIEHADLGFTLYPETKSIAGSATLTLQAKSDLNHVLLDLDSVFTIESVKVNGRSLTNNDYSNPEGVLTINLPESISSGESVKVSIDYKGVPLEAKKAPWDGGFVWNETEDGQPWIATAVQAEGCDIFWPCIDHPLREPEKVDMHITVPAPLAAAANGLYKGMENNGEWNTYHWQTLSKTNTYAISLNVGPLALMQGDYKSQYGNTIDLQYWHLKGKEEGAKKLFGEFSQILDFFESVIGPYPFGNEKMGVVDTPHLGMEHQTINAYGNGYKTDEFGFDWLLHHEFSHEWFGNQLTHRDLDDMWLHEGFGEYMQPLYAQYLYGDVAYSTYLYKKRQRIFNRAPLVSGESRTETEVYKDGPGMDIYNKGALFLHTLRQTIGDKAFFSSVRQLVYGTDTPKPGNFKPLFASTQDFIDIVNKTTGKNYTWLFKAYVYQKDLPKLVVEREDGKVNFSWKTGNDVAFDMPLEVKVGDNVVTLAMTGKQGSVSVGKGEAVTADPHSKILRDQPYIDNYRAFNRKQTRKRRDYTKKLKADLAEALEKLKKL
ncbi:MAG: M1 family metallopeptidase [Algicola sp.]|nr:M1 family metallopeptidase [Algicola sp.]